MHALTVFDVDSIIYLFKFELSLFESEQVEVHNNNKREKLERIYKRKRKLMKIVLYLNLKIK